MQIHVMDLSPGLPASEMARAMLPFVRLDRVRGGACGAVPGLSSANKIAFCHDGQLLNSKRAVGGVRATLRQRAA